MLLNTIVYNVMHYIIKSMPLRTKLFSVVHTIYDQIQIF